MANSTKTKPALIIIGAGAAGLAAAVAAAEIYDGDITLVEKRAVPGGNAVFVMGMFAARSKLQDRMGIDADEETLFRKAMDYAQWRADPRLIRVLIDRSGETVSWLETHGLIFDRIHPMYPNQVPMVFHFLKAPDKLGASYVKAFSKLCETKNIRVITNARAKQLIRDTEKKHFEVLIETKQGDIRLPAGSVVLTTGGFLGNSDLIKSYLPTYREEEFHIAGIPHTGDGIQMATQIGAALDGMAVLEMNGPVFPRSPALSVLIHQPDMLWVNKRGQRFADESLKLFPEAANSIFRQPGKTAYVLFDERIKQRVCASSLFPLDAMMVQKEILGASISKELEKYDRDGEVKITERLEELAGFIGADPAVLKYEIEAYNASCDNGHDAYFGKHQRYLSSLCKPPYYAVRAGIKIMTTHGGIKINHRMEALGDNDVPIPGLFAAGVETGCTDAGTYDGHLTGHSFGFSVVSGRIAGENAAKRIKIKV